MYGNIRAAVARPSKSGFAGPGRTAVSNCGRMVGQIFYSRYRVTYRATIGIKGMPSMRGCMVRHRKLYEEVADRLEKMISDGELRESEHLPSERELMRRFGVGRPAVREALFHLRKMGLVEIRSESVPA